MAGSFTFKRFGIEQERSAMKVGTDGVLLGAWARLEPSHGRIIDVGCGTGLIALMAAQRTEEWGARVVGVEIEEGASQDATENASRSPWAARVAIVNSPIQSYEPAEGGFDHLLSNPPYFVDSLTSPNGARTTARHTTSLSFDDLATTAARLLAPEGIMSLVLPTDAVADMTLAAARKGLFLARRTDVATKSGAKHIRSLVEYGRHPQPTLRTELTIHLPGGDFSPEYRALTKDFYLKF